MHYKIKELHKIITILTDEEGLSKNGQALLEGYAVGLETEIASNAEIIGSVMKRFSQSELDEAKRLAYKKGKTEGYWEGH